MIRSGALQDDLAIDTTSGLISNRFVRNGRHSLYYFDKTRKWDPSYRSMASAQSLAAVRKPGKEQQLILEACGTLLAVQRERRQPCVSGLGTGSVYSATLSLLCDNSLHVIERLKKLQCDDISNRTEDEFLNIIEQDHYPRARANIDSPLLHEIWTHIEQVNQRLHKQHQCRIRANPRSTFLLAIDGSRSSHDAFHTGASLRRFGTYHAFYVDQAHYFGSKSNTPEFIQREYQHYHQALGIPPSKYRFHTSTVFLSRKSSTVTRVINKSTELQTDFIVVGAHGRATPSIRQVSDDVHEMIQVARIPIIVAPWTISTSHRPGRPRFHWLLLLEEDEEDAVSNQDQDHTSPFAHHHRLVTVLLQLVHPQDRVSVLWAAMSRRPMTTRPSHTCPLATTERRLDQAQIQYQVHVCPVEEDKSIAEQVQMSIAQWSVDGLIVGKTQFETQPQQQSPQGATAAANQPIGAFTTELLKSPRCVLVICP